MLPLMPGLPEAEKRHLLLLVLLALLLRLYTFFAAPVIGTDSYNWFHAARCFAEGDFVAGLRHPTQPFYPILVAGLVKLVGSYEVAGKAVSLIMGVLALFPLYFLSRSIFGHYAALFAAFLLAVNPTHVRLSADMMSDATNLFFLLSAIWLGWEAMTTGSWKRYTAAGVCAVLSYLTRAESVALFIVMLPWLVLASGGGFRKHLLNRIVYAGLFVAPLILLSTPYLLFIHREKGVWHVTQQQAAWLASGHSKTALSVEGLRRTEERESEGERIAGWKEKGEYHMIFLLTLNELAKDFYQPFLPFLLIGLFKFSGEPGGAGISPRLFPLRLRFASTAPRAESFLLSFFGLYFFLYYLLAYNAYYISGRYVLPMAVLSFVWAGAGIERVSQYLRQVVPSPRGDTLGFNRAGLLLLMALLAMVLPKDLKIKHKEEVVKKEVGYWIRANTPGKRTVIMGIGELSLEKVAFYAEGEFRHLSPREYSMFQGFVNEWRPNYLVFYKEDLLEGVYNIVNKGERFVFLEEWIGKRKGKESHLRLYRVKEDS